VVSISFSVYGQRCSTVFHPESRIFLFFRRPYNMSNPIAMLLSIQIVGSAVAWIRRLDLETFDLVLDGADLTHEVLHI
jgi:hypothetical protein